jgi:hypothetical protein
VSTAGLLRILLCLAGNITLTVCAQGDPYGVIDVVPLQLSTDGEHVRQVELKFRETWTVAPERGSILKEVTHWELVHPQDSGSFLALVEALPGSRERKRMDELSHEFMLVDPETRQKNNLHRPLLELVSRQSPSAALYRLEDQLLSVVFMESWQLEQGADGKGIRISKRVHELSPVIWQRRQTTAGEPVNDPETGLPVYFKLQLEPIALRSP